MTRQFASWVEPIATSLATDREAVVAFASSVDPEFWSQPCEVEGWTCKHILAHLAGRNDQIVQILLRKVIAREPLDQALLNVDTDAANARRIDERIDWPLERLVEKLRDGGDEVQDLLSQLTEADRDYNDGGFPMTIANFLQIVKAERHDIEHLEQLRRVST